jgi:hypothetical protein
MKKKKQIQYLILGSFLFGGVLVYLNDILWSLFFLLLISFLITKLISNTNVSFGKQMLSASIGVFFLGWVAAMIILVGKVLVRVFIGLFS